MIPRLIQEGSESRVGRCVVLSLLGVLLVATVAHGARRTLMYKMQPRAHGAAEGVTREQIRLAVIQCIQSRTWSWYVRTSGVVEADISLSRGKHKATIAVVFDDRDYVVRYVSSYNLGYGDRSCRAPETSDVPGYLRSDKERLRERRASGCVAEIIHPTYNDWVRQLEEAIAARVRELRPRAPLESEDGDVAMLAEVEARTLQALRASGVLTEAELQSQKRLLRTSPTEPTGRNSGAP